MRESTSDNLENQPARDRAGDVAVSIPQWMSAALIERTRIVWQKIYQRAISHDEAVTILAHVGRLLDCLA